MRMPEGDGPVETVSAGDFDLTAGRCGGAARYGASVVRFEDALERYRNRRLTAEEEASGAFARVGFACLALFARGRSRHGNESNW